MADKEYKEAEKIGQEEFIRRYVRQDTLSYRIIRGILIPLVWLFYHPRYHGLENVPKEGALILCMNHRGAPDPVFMIVALKKRCVRYIAKKSLHDGPFGFIFRMALTVPVDRNRQSPEVMAAAETVLENGGVIGIFPEGTRNRSEQILLPFKYGAVRLAQVTGARIIPLVATGRYLPFVSRVDVYIGEPYEISKDADLEAENQKLYDTMYAMYVANAGNDRKVKN